MTNSESQQSGCQYSEAQEQDFVICHSENEQPTKQSEKAWERIEPHSKGKGIVFALLP